MACSVSAEKSPDSLIGFTLYIACCFSLAAFNIFSLIFSHFIYNICEYFHFLVNPGCVFLYFLDSDIFFPSL